ncbi:MAG: PCI domain-containing protein [Candidatus Hodarchaeales archaeon]|jgi:hypothetical protein
MDMEKRLVIISAGIELSPLISEFLNAGLGFSIILNTTADFSLSNHHIKEKDKEKGEEVWYHHEIIKLANAIVPDDLSKSSLTKIFSHPIAQTRIPLSDAEMFLVQWVSDRKKGNQNFYEFFKAINEYAGKNLDVYTLKFPDEAVSIKTSATQVPLRYFQITGYIDRNAEQKTDLEELQRLFVENQKSMEKKKTKRPIEIFGFDPNRDILTEEAKKELAEADAILWLSGDPCSLALLLLHKGFIKAVKESKAPVTLIAPNRMSFREQFILQLLDIKPTMLGIVELSAGIVDNLVVGPDEAGEITSLRSKGFNVIMEDMSKNRGKKGLSAIVKGMGISLKDISVASEELDKTRSLEDLVTELSYSKVEEQDNLEKSADLEVKSETKSETITDSSTELSPNDTNQYAVELMDTQVKSHDFNDPSLALTQEHWGSLMQELTEGGQQDKLSTVVINQDLIDSTTINLEKDNSTTQFESQDDFTEALQTLLKSENINQEGELVQGIKEAISKNADIAIYAAKKLTAALDPQQQQLIQIYLEFLKPRPLTFIKELLDWLLSDLKSPDFLDFSQRVSVVVSMNKIDSQFVEQLVAQVVDFHINKSLPPFERERVRTIIGMISARVISLQRRAIHTYLSLYETHEGKHDEIWLGLLKFDAALVAIEIIEHQSSIGVKLVQDALSRNLASFGHIIYDIFHAYQKGDLQRVLSVAGTLSNALLRKRRRKELAEKVIKFGSVPIETLARSVEIDPKELEELVYEMINENEINAKIEVVEGRLTIVQLNDKDKKSEETTE